MGRGRLHPRPRQDEWKWQVDTGNFDGGRTDGNPEWVARGKHLTQGKRCILTLVNEELHRKFHLSQLIIFSRVVKRRYYFMYTHHRKRYIGKFLCNPPLVSMRQAQPYRFKVRARNGLGWSEFGPPTPPVVLNPLQPCEAPELVDRGVTWLALKLRAPPGAGLLLGFEMHMYVGR